MPRLDNSRSENLRILREWGESRWLHIELNPEDPGDMPPMDVCMYCWEELFCEHDDGMVEHPWYDGEGYTCACCQRPLDDGDDFP